MLSISLFIVFVSNVGRQFRSGERLLVWYIAPCHPNYSSNIPELMQADLTLHTDYAIKLH